MAANTGMACELEKASPIIVVTKIAPNRSYAYANSPVPPTITARIWEDLIGAWSMAAKAVLQGALLSVAGGFVGFSSSIMDAGSTERIALIVIMIGENESVEEKSR